MVRRLGRLCALFVLAVVLFVGLLFASIQTGSLDRMLAEGARNALDAGLEPMFSAKLGATAIRFSGDFRLSIEAREVSARHNQTGLMLGRAESVKFIIDPFALLVGRIEVDEIAADHVVIDAAVMPAGPPIDLAALRVDAAPAVMEHAFAELDTGKSFMAKAGLDRVRLSDVSIKVGSKANPFDVGFDEVTLERDANSALTVNGVVSVKGQPAVLHVESAVKGGITSVMNVRLSDFDVSPILLRRDSSGDIRQGFGGVTAIAVDAVRAGASSKPVLSANITTTDGIFYTDGKSQKVTSADIKLGYDFTKNTLEFRQSKAVFGDTVIPFTGGLIDLDRYDTSLARGTGIGIDLLAKDATASVPDSGERPVPFDLKIFGRYLYADRSLEVDQLGVSTPGGIMTGSARVLFGDESPQVSFSAQLRDMQTAVVKQLWPFWIADKPRAWVMSNLFGGIVRQASVDVFIPAGRMKLEPSPLHLDKNELRLSFDIENARANVTGDIPPVRDTDAHVEMHGGDVQVTFKEGVSYFPSGRTVSLKGGTLKIADAYIKPLMADIDVDVAGAAAAVAELVSYKPINALEKAGFSIDDFTGAVTAKAKIHVGLIRSQDPPPPDWQAHLELSKVNVAKEFSGKKITDVNASLDIDPSSARLDGSGLLDGAPMDIKLVEPIDKDLGAKRERVVTLTLDDAARKRLAPGLNEVVSGTMKAELSYVDDTRWDVSADLRSSVFSLPWLGWSKGSGIPAQAQFSLVQEGERTRVENLKLTGDGFGASGDIVVGSSGLVSADIGNMQLSPGDSFSVRLRSAGGGYDVRVNGKSADLRSVIADLKSPAEPDDGQTKQKGPPLRITVALDRVVGFSGEALSSVTLSYGSAGGKLNALALKGVTGSGEAIVGNLAAGQNGDELTVTSGDAGALLRFINLYDRMRGGLLNLKMITLDQERWNGTVDVRNFRVENEQRLQSMVSTPTGADGQSLNNAVKRDIDVSSEKFQRGFARLSIAGGRVALDSGVVRGEQIGATFQGVVRDASGNMDMTGTFMPAYGLNRLFGELPVIGLLLGNGRDRGLLGITFKLTGSTSSPKLVINPLSIIAPGVFRSIFEFH